MHRDKPVRRVERRRKQAPWTWLAKALFQAILRSADLLESNVFLCVGVIAIVFLPVSLIQAHKILLTNDEIYTVHIAQAPTLRAMFSMAREIDLHPPLHYLAERVALAVPAPRWLAARLPNILAGMVFCLALFRYVQKRLGNLYGLAAVAVFWLSAEIDFAWSDRPYMQWLMWLVLLLLCRDVAMPQKRPWWATVAVFGAASAMVLTHLLGVACLWPFWLVESLRIFQRRRVDWPMAAAISLPVLWAALGFYQMHHVQENVFPPDKLPSLQLAVTMYGDVTGYSVLVLPACYVGLMLMFGKVRASPRFLSQAEGLSQQGGFDKQDLVVLAGLLLLPVLLFLPSGIFHLQFWPRYAAMAVIAWAALAAQMIAHRLSLAKLFAVVALCASVGFLVYRVVSDVDVEGHSGGGAGVGRSPIQLSSLHPELPIVAASPMTFVEMSDRESPAVAQRLYYLTDHNAAMQYAHYTLFENEDKIAKLLQLPSHVEKMEPFLREHDAFYMVGTYDAGEIWLLRSLAANGAKMDYLGKFASTYETDDLYLVSR
jgi:hypothetical protein